MVQENRTEKVLIEDIPLNHRDVTSLETYVSGLVKLSCSVKQYGKRFVATFQNEIGEL